MRALLAILVIAILPSRTVVAQGSGFVIHGEVMSTSRTPVEATIHFADGTPDIRTDRVGKFQFVRSSRDSLQVTVDAKDYLDAYIVIHPGRDSIVRVVIKKFGPIPGLSGVDISSVGDGVMVAFEHVANIGVRGDSLRVRLVSKKIFGCLSGIDVTAIRESTRLSLHATRIVTNRFCEGQASRATWETTIPVTPPLDEVVVVVDRHADRFALRRSATGLCAKSLGDPKTTLLIADRGTSSENPTSSNPQSLEMPKLPGALPAC